MPTSDGELFTKFTLESERGGIVDEPPFRMLVLGDWSGSAEKRDLASRRPISIDRDNFDEVMNKLGAALELDLNGDGSSPVSLRFTELEDFHPDRIFGQVPLFAELRDVRRRLKSEDTFYEAARHVRSWFPEPEKDVVEAPSAEPSAANAGEEPQDLLGQILAHPGGGAVPVRSRTTESSELNALLADLVRPHLVRVDENEQAAMLSAVDNATGELMRRILHDHKFQAFEAAWRGLFFMVRRTETDTDLSIHLLDVTKDELSESLANASNLSDTPLYKTLITDAVETPGSDAWAVTVGAFDFMPHVDDIAMLVRIAKLSAAADAPFVSHMRPDVLGVHSLEGNTDPKLWDMSTDADEGKLWYALRSVPEAEYLGLSIPRFLARLPYGADTDPLESFSFEEFADSPHHDGYLWANSCFVVGSLLAESYREFGWQMGGGRFKQDISGLPLHVYKRDGETVYTSCAEVQLTDVACDKLMEYGLMPLVSYKNADHARLGRVQSITDPVSKLKGMWN